MLLPGAVASAKLNGLTGKKREQDWMLMLLLEITASATLGWSNRGGKKEQTGYTVRCHDRNAGTQQQPGVHG